MRSSQNVAPRPSRGSTSRGEKLQNPMVMSYIRDEWVKQQLELRKAEYMDIQDFTIATGTWNVNAKKPVPPSQSEQLRLWLQPKDEASVPDIYAFGFQEIVDLNAVNVMVQNSSQQKSAQWDQTIQYALATLPNAPEYELLMDKNLVGLLLLVYIKRSLRPYVSAVQAASAGVGVMGMMGNKGGVVIRFQLQSSTLCFVCSHLAAHRENVAGRNADFANIVNKVEFMEYGKSELSTKPASPGINSNAENRGYGILDHDFVFWIGDLNYRVIDDVSVDKCFARIEHKDLEFLLRRDQLNIERERGNVFQQFEEGPIHFRPTYKFQPGTSLYERRPEKKTRAPAWCDRILWKITDPAALTLRDYSSVENLLLSDHKPVKAAFEVKIQSQIESERSRVFREIMHQLDKWENENMPKVKIEGSIISFPQVFFMQDAEQVFWVQNIGQVVAHFRFIPKEADQATCKPWLHVSPMYGMIPPKERIQITARVLVDIPVAQELASGSDTIDDTLILRIENGRDYFVVVSGQYQKSCFGMSLQQLVHIKGAARYSNESITDSTPQIPKELWRIVDEMYRDGMKQKGIWIDRGMRVSYDEIADLREALDTGSKFPNHSAYSMAQLLILFLRSLRDPLIPDHLIMNCEVDPARIQLTGRAVLNGLAQSPVHYNVFVYLISFLREYLQHARDNKSSSAELSYVFASCMLSTEINDSTSSRPDQISMYKLESMQRLLNHFLTTSTL